MNKTRRSFLKTAGTATSLVLTGAMLPQQLSAHARSRSEPTGSIQDPQIRELVHKALDAARSAGATYADARLTRQRERQIGFAWGVNEKEERMIGVRALVNGYWGFACGAMLHPDEMVRLGREAVNLAKTNALGQTRTLELAPASRISDTHWEMPVEIDPFAVHTAEMVDFLDGMSNSYQKTSRRLSRGLANGGDVRSGAEFWKQEKAYGSTDGSYGTQVLYRTAGLFEVVARGQQKVGGPEFRLDFLSPAGIGWELYTRRRIHDDIERAVERHLADKRLPVMPVDVGRYQTVLDAESIAKFVSSTLGAATELDRAFGYEANAGGTSYLNAPSEMLNTLMVGAPTLTVTTNRTEPGGAATVGWDDDGVMALEITLVENGKLRAFQTTRESAGWLQDNRQAKAPESTACASAATGSDEPLGCTGNLVVQPGKDSREYNDMIKDIDSGIVFENLNVMTDFQQLGGIAWGRAYKVRNGKKESMLDGAGILFRAPDLWKSILAIGGAGSARRFGQELLKGEPAQMSYHSVTSPPMALKDVTVIDVRRKA